MVSLPSQGDDQRVLELVGQTASGYPLRTKSVYSDLGFMILPDTEQDTPLAGLYYTMGDGDLF